MDLVIYYFACVFLFFVFILIFVNNRVYSTKGSALGTYVLRVDLSTERVYPAHASGRGGAS